MILTDTPGLYAGKKEEHDVLSLQKIKESDILAFCITTSLFDDLLIKNFVDLAYNQAYKSGKLDTPCRIMLGAIDSEIAADFSKFISNFDFMTKGLEKENASVLDMLVGNSDNSAYVTELKALRSQICDLISEIVSYS